MPPHGINLTELDAFLEAKDAHREYHTSTTNRLVNFALPTNTVSLSGGSGTAYGTNVKAGGNLNDFVNKMVNAGLKASGNFWSADVPDSGPFTEPVVHFEFTGPTDVAVSSLYLSIEQLAGMLTGNGLVFNIGNSKIICNVQGDWTLWDKVSNKFRDAKFGEQSKFFDVLNKGLGR